MTRRFLILAALTLTIAAPVAAAPATVALVNATGSDISAMDARRSGTTSWSAVPFSARSGESGAATFDTEDCAWDLRITVAGGGTFVYRNVNICEAQLLTLRRKDGVAWIDYR